MFSVCFNQTKHWRSCSLNQNVISTNQRVLRPAKPTEKQRIVLGRDLATCDEELCENGDRKDKKIIVKNKVNFWKLSLCNRVAWMVLLVELFGCIKHAWDNKNKKKAKMMLLLLVYNRCSEIAHFFDFFISWIFFLYHAINDKSNKITNLITQKNKSRSLPDKDVLHESVKLEQRNCKTASPGKRNAAHRTSMKCFVQFWK